MSLKLREERWRERIQSFAEVAASVESDGSPQLEKKEGGGKTGLKNLASSGDAAVGTERGRTPVVRGQGPGQAGRTGVQCRGLAHTGGAGTGGELTAGGAGLGCVFEEFRVLRRCLSGQQMMGEAEPGRAETRGEGWGWSAPGECEVLASSQKNAETKRQVRGGFFQR